MTIIAGLLRLFKYANHLHEGKNSSFTISFIAYPDSSVVGMPNVVEYGPDSVAVVLEWIHDPDNGVSHSVDAAPLIINMTSPTQVFIFMFSITSSIM